MMGWIIAALIALGVRCWRDIDHDACWTLQRCAWTGERRTVVYGRNIRRLQPGRRPRCQRG